MAWTTLTADPRDPPREGDDRAVSPVIGMILVLGVTVVGVMAVLYWGLPQVSDMKSEAEFQAVEQQFEDLNSNIDALTRGTPGETAKRWQPAFERGAVTFENGSQRWILLTDVKSGEDWALGSLYDEDNNFTVFNTASGTDHDIAVDAWTIDAGVEDPITVSDAVDCSATSDTDDMDAVTVASGDTQYLCLYEDNERFPVDGETLKLEIRDDSLTGDDAILARAYLFDVGALHYIMTMGPSQRDAFQTNGALVAGEPDDLEVRTDPPFGPPRDAGDTTRFFGRIIELDGEGAFGGTDAQRFSVLLSLYSTATLEDTDGVESLKVWVDGETADAWYEYYTRDNTAYAFVKDQPSEVPDYLDYSPTGGFDLKLVHSIVDMEVT